MSGSGARDGGSPPWGPADPVPDFTDTQAMPGLGGMRQAARRPAARGRAGSPRAPAGRGAPARRRGSLERWPRARRPPGRQSLDTAARCLAERAGRARTRPRNRGAGRAASAAVASGASFPVLVVIALVLALVIKSFVVQAFWIPSGSMENTLEVNDRVLINKLVYHLRPIHRGDIIVFDGTGSWNFGPPADSNIFSKAVRRARGDRRHQPRLRHLHQAGDRPARRPRGLLQRQRPGHRQRRPAVRELLPVPGQRAVRPEVQHHGPARPPVGDGRPPGRLLRLPRPPGRPGRRHHPGERRPRPRLRDHLAAEPRGLPQHPGHLRAAAAERLERRATPRPAAQPPPWSRPRQRHPRPPRDVPAAPGPRLRRRRPPHLAPAPRPPPPPQPPLRGTRTPRPCRRHERSPRRQCGSGTRPGSVQPGDLASRPRSGVPASDGCSPYTPRRERRARRLRERARARRARARRGHRRGGPRRVRRAARGRGGRARQGRDQAHPGTRRLQAADRSRAGNRLRGASSSTRSTGTSRRSRIPRSTPSGCTCATSRACAAPSRG